MGERRPVSMIALDQALQCCFELSSAWFLLRTTMFHLVKPHWRSRLKAGSVDAAAALKMGDETAGSRRGPTHPSAFCPAPVLRARNHPVGRVLAEQGYIRPVAPAALLRSSADASCAAPELCFRPGKLTLPVQPARVDKVSRSL